MKRLTALLLIAAVPAPAQDDGLAVWGRIYEVLSHPRCVNCHVGADNLPRWSGPSYGEARAHGMNVDAGLDRIGATTLICNTCHMPQNADQSHGPPGAGVWMLAPAGMDWWGKSSAEVCAQVRSSARTDSRDLQQMAMRLARNPLVTWSWDPGPGREAAPYSVEQLANFIEAWADAGAPCPE